LRGIKRVGFNKEVAGFRVQSSEFRVQGSVFRCAGFKIVMFSERNIIQTKAFFNLKNLEP
jgi:hypothetical protein